MYGLKTNLKKDRSDVVDAFTNIPSKVNQNFPYNDHLGSH